MYVGVLALLLVSCGGAKDQDPESAAAEGSSAVQVPTGGGTATTIHLVVGGGPHAGTYDAKSNDLTCTYGFAGHLEGHDRFHEPAIRRHAHFPGGAGGRSRLESVMV